MAVLSLAIFLGSYFLPFIGFVLMFAVGVPLTILVVRRNLPVAGVAAAAVTLLVTFLFGFLIGARFLIMYEP